MGSFELAEAFFRCCLGDGWKESPPVRISGRRAIELLWPLNDVFRQRLHKIQDLEYDPLLEPAADGAIDDLAATLDSDVIGAAPAGVLRVLQERHLQLLVVAVANQKAGNTVTQLPSGLSEDQQRAGLALLLLRGMRLLWPPGKAPVRDDPGQPVEPA